MFFLFFLNRLLPVGMHLKIAQLARKSREVSMRRISDRVLFSWASFLLLVSFWSAAANVQILVHFDLPAQSLAQSLKEIGTATNTDVGFRASQVAGLLPP